MLRRKRGRRGGRNVDKEVMCEDQFIFLGRVGAPLRRVSHDVHMTAEVSIMKSSQTVFISGDARVLGGDTRDDV